MRLNFVPTNFFRETPQVSFFDKDVAVFREAYRLVGLGWIYAPTSWPILRSVIDLVYKLWTKYRLPLTRRPSLEQLCKWKEICK